MRPLATSWPPPRRTALANGGALEDAELGDGAADLGDVDPRYRAVLALGDESQVDDPDDAAVDEVDQVRDRLAGRLPALPLDQHVVDRADLQAFLTHPPNRPSVAVLSISNATGICRTRG